MIVNPITREDCKLLYNLGCKDLESNSYRLVMPEKFKCKHVCTPFHISNAEPEGSTHFDVIWQLFLCNR